MSIPITVALHLCLLLLPVVTGAPKVIGWVLSLTYGEGPNATAALVLPKWALTGLACLRRDINIQSYYVVGSMWSGKTSQSKVKKARNIAEMFLALELSSRFPVGFPTIPIATRTDAYIAPKCWTYVNKNKVSAYPTNMIPLGDCQGYAQRGRVVCGVSIEKHCYPPCGTAMVCQGRLVGIRRDEMECTLNKVLKFSSMAFYDYKILEKPFDQNDGYTEDFPANVPIKKVVASSSSVAWLRIYLIFPVSILIYCDV